MRNNKHDNDFPKALEIRWLKIYPGTADWGKPTEIYLAGVYSQTCFYT